MKKYNEAKRRNQEVQKFAHHHVSDKMEKRICECGNWREFLEDLPRENRRAYAANYCKWRFCPVCAMQKARVDSLRISTLMTYISQEHNKSFVFVTLTTPNVRKDELPDAIDRYSAAFRVFINHPEIAKINSGFVRKLEITYDGEPTITKEMYKKKRDHYKRRGLRVGDPNPTYDTYHPHLHVVMAVNRGYFYGGKYLKQTRWLELWQEAMDDDSITQVDVRAVVNRKKDVNTLSGGFNALEFAKYAAKDEDYTHSAEVFDTFYTALKGRRVLTYGGLFASANKKYKNDELEEYIKADKTEYYWVVMYTWKGTEYCEREVRELDEMDRLFLANRGIDVKEAFRDG